MSRPRRRRLLLGALAGILALIGLGLVRGNRVSSTWEDAR